MNSYPLITIGITSYNHAAFIRDTLDSVLAEDYPNKEIVLVDDGSTDNSVELIRQWIDEHRDEIKVKLISRPNRGVSYTMNEVIENTEGQYIVFLASDDMLCNNGIRKRMECMQATGKLGVVGDTSVIDNNGNITHRSWIKDIMKVDATHLKTEEGLMREMLVNPSFAGSTLLLNKDVYKKIGKYPENFYAEEWFFYQRSSAKRYMIYLDEVVSLYRRHDANASGTEMKMRKHLVKSIIKTYRISWHLFPGSLKLVALRQWWKWIKIYTYTFLLKK